MRRSAQPSAILLVTLLGCCLLLGNGSPPALAGNSTPSPAAVVGDTLTLFTLNVAHARGSALNQLLVSESAHRENLAAIATTLRNSRVDIAALQEADGPSRWSGGFDHVQLLSELSALPGLVHGRHAESWLFSYGAALLSRTLLQDPGSHSFEPSWPSATKGFVHGTLQWQPDQHDSRTVPVTAVSVHLDFSRKSVRAAQVEELLQQLAGFSRPLIVMGDFNAEWFQRNSLVRRLAEGARLQAYQPESSALATYRNSARLDWILLSGELTFREYRVLPDVISDHLAVVARVGFKGNRRVTQ